MAHYPNNQARALNVSKFSMPAQGENFIVGINLVISFRPSAATPSLSSGIILATKLFVLAKMRLRILQKWQLNRKILISSQGCQLFKVNHINSDEKFSAEMRAHIFSYSDNIKSSFSSRYKVTVLAWPTRSTRMQIPAPVSQPYTQSADCIFVCIQLLTAHNCPSCIIRQHLQTVYLMGRLRLQSVYRVRTTRSGPSTPGTRFARVGFAKWITVFSSVKLLSR